jgi:hypothetical protein
MVSGDPANVTAASTPFVCDGSGQRHRC